MSIFLVLVPLFVVISAFYMYRYTGRRQIMKLDLVQFAYAFVIAPVLFIWLKSFLFLVLRTELDLRLSVSNLFLVDGVFSVLFLYVFAFVVIHSLTKTFNLKMEKDPLYDLFEHSEYFHLWLSHVVIYFGAMVLVGLVSLMNLILPLSISMTRDGFYSVLGLAVTSGIVAFAAVWNYDSPDPRFYRLMKLLLGVFFLLHAGLFFVFDPSFSPAYMAYWFIFTLFMSTVVLALFEEKPDAESRFSQLPFTLNWRKPTFYVTSIRRWFSRAIIGN